MNVQLDHDVFFEEIRAILGPITQQQVDGLNTIMGQATSRGTRWDKLANMLATVWLETNATFQPVEEAYWVKNAAAWRRKNLRYWPYHGRGYVQITWYENYLRATRYFQEVLGIPVDFTKNPDLVMIPGYAAIIMFVGMEEGWFTVKKLDDYLDGIDESDVEDYEEFKQARRVINGVDRWHDIAKYSIQFENALRKAGYGPKPVADTVPQRPGAGPVNQTPEEEGLTHKEIESLAEQFAPKRPAGPAPSRPIASPPGKRGGKLGWEKLGSLLGQMLAFLVKAGRNKASR